MKIKFRIAKIILLKCPYQAKKSVSLDTLNNLKKEFPWLLVELEKKLPSGLFCKVCLKYEDKVKGIRECDHGYDGKFVSEGTEAVVQKCSVKKVFLEIS